MIPVTKTFLPPQEEYQQILKKAWEAGWITNRGSLVLELEEQLKDYLDVPNIIATTNGTLPLQIAIKALDLKGEIITTPFSYVATTSSIVWENCQPLFVDINPDYLTIDEYKIEAAINTKTSAILATHVFGNPCNVEVIEKIAKKYELKVIYDAAHCFGVTYKGNSIFNYGDISTCSFHATKIFHTGEGGAIFCKDRELNQKLYYFHNFGHDGPGNFKGLGINAKMSELQAAMGLAVMPYCKELKENRYDKYKIYQELLIEEVDSLTTQKVREGTGYNYSYFPIIFRTEKDLVRVKEHLEKNDIFPRRYFYPSLNKLNYVKYSSVSNSERISETILCLPFYQSLNLNDQYKIIDIIKRYA